MLSVIKHNQLSETSLIRTNSPSNVMSVVILLISQPYGVHWDSFIWFNVSIDVKCKLQEPSQTLLSFSL